jgi:hypothetical protein
MPVTALIGKCFSGKQTQASRIGDAGCVVWMEENETADLEQLCQGVSLGDAACNYSATVRCTTCGRWFCDAHAEDEQWHPCMLPPGDEGGEA